jgi:hypothetical protein
LWVEWDGAWWVEGSKSMSQVYLGAWGGETVKPLLLVSNTGIIRRMETKKPKKDISMKSNGPDTVRTLRPNVAGSSHVPYAPVDSDSCFSYLPFALVWKLLQFRKLESVRHF